MYDEPTAGLDPVASTVVEDLIRSLHRSVTLHLSLARVQLLFEGSGSESEVCRGQGLLDLSMKMHVPPLRAAM